MVRKNRHIRLSRLELWFVWIAMALVTGLGALGVWLFMPPTPDPPIEMKGDLRLALADLPGGKLKLFTYAIDGSHALTFSVVNTNSAVLVTAASCRRCYRSGYHQVGNEIFCRRCGERMPLGRAGQPPAPDKDCTLLQLPFEREGNQIVVRGEALRQTFEKWFRPNLGGQDQVAGLP